MHTLRRGLVLHAFSLHPATAPHACCCPLVPRAACMPAHEWEHLFWRCVVRVFSPACCFDDHPAAPRRTCVYSKVLRNTCFAPPACLLRVARCAWARFAFKSGCLPNTHKAAGRREALNSRTQSAPLEETAYPLSAAPVPRDSHVRAAMGAHAPRGVNARGRRGPGRADLTAACKEARAGTSTASTTVGAPADGAKLTAAAQKQRLGTDAHVRQGG